ncbi:MAG: hypothetical protein WC515_05540 [Candidatus Omnitrophota bacterium]
MKEYCHYRMILLNRKISFLEYKTKGEAFAKTETFLRPVTSKSLPKIYIIKNRGEIIYIGIASQSIANRLRYGFSAKGRGGYHGYRWRDLVDKIDLLVWCFPGQSMHYVESIEAEIVFALRRDTGKWPAFQTEIHFHNVTDEEKKLASSIYSEASKTA